MVCWEAHLCCNFIGIQIWYQGIRYCKSAIVRYRLG
nr:MAG TPA_asm: hypothetical protein [Caudoviricetes sp.]